MPSELSGSAAPREKCFQCEQYPGYVHLVDAGSQSERKGKATGFIPIATIETGTSYSIPPPPSSCPDN